MVVSRRTRAAHRRYTFALAVTVAVVAASCGGTTSGTVTPVQPSATTFDFTGTVSGDPSGAPIAGARVAISDGPNAGRSATTNASGAFSLTGLARSGFTAMFSAQGFVDGSRPVTLDRNVQLDVRLVAVPVVRTWTVSGTVIDDAANRPISGATVAVLDGVNQGRSATTNGAGSYAITGLREGGFTMRATASGFQNGDRSLSLTSNQTVDFRLRAPSTGGGGDGGLGSGARVVFETQNACPCTRGGNTIALRLNNNTVGSMSCSSGSRTVDVAPGRYTVKGCDPSGSCWNSEDVSLGNGDEGRYTMSCASGLSTSGPAVTKILR